MQRLDADAALFVAVQETLQEDVSLMALLPGGAHIGKIPLGQPYPSLAWIIKGGQRDRNFGIVASQQLSVWFKVNTESSDSAPRPYAGAAANARIRELFDGADVNRWKTIKPALDAKLRPHGWHLQDFSEFSPIPASEEPIGDDLTQFTYVIGGIYHVKMQPVPVIG